MAGGRTLLLRAALTSASPNWQRRSPATGIVVAEVND